MLAPFPIQPYLTAIAVKYRNRRMIADDVSPRLPVGMQTFKYLTHTMAEGFTIPDTAVGRRGQPEQIEFTAVETSASTLDYGLDDPLPQSDIENAPVNYDQMARSVEGLTDLIALDRERRVAALIHGTGSYAGTNQQTLSGTSQFSDFVNSDPIGVIGAALDTPVIRPNIGVIGRAAWTKLRSHPKIVMGVLGTAATTGAVSARAVADLFELDELFVGEGFYNSARRGQTPVMSRVWGKHLALIYNDRQASASGKMPSFCWTAQWGSRIAGAVPDKYIGLRGGQRVRVGESVKEIISANDLGYLIANAVA